jgi:thymidylate synthase
MLFINTVDDIREQFAALYTDGEFVTDKFGGKVIEIIGASFIADEELIFGAVNEDYVERELQWYESQSLYVNDIPGGAPKIWQQVACKNGRINSNYGWCIWNSANGNQLDQVIAELKKNPESRRAVAIYTRPSMWEDYNENGRSDFMCTNAVQYLVRDGKLNVVVQMRSNDAWAGYRNDYAWQKHVLDIVANELNVKAGDIYWNAGSLHIYDRQFYLVDNYVKTGEISITKEKYDELYKVA